MTLTVIDTNGASDSISKNVIVNNGFSIDIKPGDYPNTINTHNRGKIPVAILTTDAFDASTVNPGTVVFLGASPCMTAKLEDVDDDGDKDMIFHFKTQELDFDQIVTEGDYIYAYLTGQTFYNELYLGRDTVNIVYSIGYGILIWFLEHFPIVGQILNKIYERLN